MLGLISPAQTASRAPSQWRKVKSAFIRTRTKGLDGPLLLEQIDEVLAMHSEKKGADAALKSKRSKSTVYFEKSITFTPKLISFP